MALSKLADSLKEVISRWLSALRDRIDAFAQWAGRASRALYFATIDVVVTVLTFCLLFVGVIVGFIYYRSTGQMAGLVVSTAWLSLLVVLRVYFWPKQDLKEARPHLFLTIAAHAIVIGAIAYGLVNRMRVVGPILLTYADRLLAGQSATAEISGDQKALRPPTVASGRVSELTEHSSFRHNSEVTNSEMSKRVRVDERLNSAEEHLIPIKSAYMDFQDARINHRPTTRYSKAATRQMTELSAELHDCSAAMDALVGPPTPDQQARYLYCTLLLDALRGVHRISDCQRLARLIPNIADEKRRSKIQRNLQFLVDAHTGRTPVW